MLYFLDDEFWTYPLLVLAFLLSFSAVTFIRYLLLSVVYKVILEWIAGTTRSAFNKNGHQITRELKWAALSSLVFTIIGAMGLFVYQADLTAIYHDIHEHSIGYFLLSPLLLLFLYETYYYWLHRWMHNPKIYNLVHKVHHTSTKPTVFTAFSFHPVEAALQFLFFPLFLMVIPMHPIMLGVVFLMLTFLAMVNHGGVEIYGNGFFIRHFIGSTHHDLHHQEFKTNYGLNFTWWDNIMKTESKERKAGLRASRTGTGNKTGTHTQN